MIPLIYVPPAAPFNWRGLALDMAGTAATFALMAGILYVGVVA